VGDQPAAGTTSSAGAPSSVDKDALSKDLDDIKNLGSDISTTEQSLQDQLDTVKAIPADQLSAADMFAMQQLMNQLTQQSEMRTNVSSAAKSAMGEPLTDEEMMRRENNPRPQSTSQSQPPVGPSGASIQAAQDAVSKDLDELKATEAKTVAAEQALQDQLDALRATPADQLSADDLQTMRQLANQLSQLSEMHTSITSAMDSAINSMARNVKG
jgi:hypothetical protein